MRKIILSILFASLFCSCGQNTTSTGNASDPNTQNTNAAKTGDPSRVNIDPVKVSPEIFKVLEENQHVRVVEYTLKPGEKDKWHTHPAKSSYVVTGGKLKVTLENGETLFVSEETGTASWMENVGKHYVENVGNTTVKIVFTEIKSVN